MRSTSRFLASVATLCLLNAAPAVADDDNELAFNGHCRECHSFEKDDNRLGPSLYGVIGRKAGTEKGFEYSEAVKNSGITWDAKLIDKWITDPNAVIPGNNMGTIFSGLKDAATRAKIIAFLKTKSPNVGKK